MLIFRKINTTTYTTNDGVDDFEIVREPGLPFWGAFKNKYWMLIVRASMAQAKAACELESRRCRFMSRDEKKEAFRQKSLKFNVAFGVRVFYNGEVEANGCSREVLLTTCELLRKQGINAKEIPMAKTSSSKTAAAPVAAAPAQAAAAAVAEAPKEPRQTITLNEDEIQQLFSGNLKPRATKGDPDQAALTDKDEKGRPKGRPVGVLTGFGILGSWCYAFQENAKLPNQVTGPAKGVLGRKPDSAITAFMEADFPGRETPAFKHPQGCRNDYNNGVFTKNQKPPTMSVPYNEKGEQIEPTARGRKEAEAATAAAAPAAPAAAAPQKGKPAAKA
jgi:hypothetical protein